MTSETTEGAGTGAPEEPRQALETPAERFAHALTPANETPPPPPPEPANSDLPAPAQAWPLAWLRRVEPEPPATDGVVAAVIAAEPADADGVAHAFAHASGQVMVMDVAEPADAGGVAHAFDLAMAAALDPEPVFEADAAVEPAARAFYSGPVVEPPDAPPAAESDGLSAAEAEDVRGAATTSRAAAEETAVAEPEEPLIVTPVYAARRAAARRAAAEAEGDTPGEGQAGEGGAAAAAYLFYLVGFLLVPAVAGVFVAYNARRTAPAWLQSHYLFLIRTFWIGLTATAIAAALLFSGKLTLGGLVLALLLIVWLEMRSAMGFINLVKLRALSRPRSWLF